MRNHSDDTRRICPKQVICLRYRSIKHRFAKLLDVLDKARAKLKSPPLTILFSSLGTPWTTEGFGTSFDRHRARHGFGPDDKGPTIHDMRKTCATNLFVLQQRYPGQITNQVFLDLFGWTPGTLHKMKRIYVSDDAVIDALSGGK